MFSFSNTRRDFGYVSGKYFKEMKGKKRLKQSDDLLGNYDSVQPRGCLSRTCDFLVTHPSFGNLLFEICWGRVVVKR